MKDYNYLLEHNAIQVKEKLKEDPNFYKNLAKGQQPRFLWIGCSDSRVPANEITGTEAGDIFVHRNIANLVNNTDMSVMSVVAFAVGVLKVRHVIICGHYGCGGVQAAISQKNVGILNKWVRQIKDTYVRNEQELKPLSEEDKVKRLVELNVIEQVHHLAKSHIIQQEWKEREVYIHGWVYDLSTGLIKDLQVDVSGIHQLPEIYQLDV